MHVKRPNPIPAVLALAFAALIVVPATTMAASGLPATIVMDPESAAPGSTVQVTGVDFPAGQVVELELRTTSGRNDLAVFVTEEGGYFDERVTLPADIQPGAWELHATALDGATAMHAFIALGEATDVTHPQPLVEAEDEAVVAEAGLTSGRGNSSTDIMVMLVISVLLAAVAGGAAYAWREVKHDHEQPGMSTGDDPIWAGAGPGSDPATPEMTASNGPEWTAAQDD